MEKILFSKENFSVIFNLIVNTIKEQKGIDISSEEIFHEEIKRVFVETYKLNSISIKNAMNENINRRDIVLKFNKSVLINSLRSISRIIDDRLNSVKQKNNLNDTQQSSFRQMQQVASDVNVSTVRDNPLISSFKPEIQQKNTEVLKNTYEDFLKTRDQMQKPANDLFNNPGQVSNTLPGFLQSSNTQSQSNTVDFKDDRTFDDSGKLDDLYSRQMSLRDEIISQGQEPNRLSNKDIADILMETDPHPKDPDIEQDYTNIQPSIQSKPKKIFVNSSTSKLDIEIPEGLFENIQLKSLDFRPNRNNINNSNNVVYIIETSKEGVVSDTKICIDPGFYTQEEFLDELRNQMTNKYTVQLNSKTGKVTIELANQKNTSGSKYIKTEKTEKTEVFELAFKDSLMNKVLGFNDVILSGSYSYTAQKKINMSIANCLYIYLNSEPLEKVVFNQEDDFVSKELNLQIPVNSNLFNLEFCSSFGTKYDFDNEEISAYLEYN